MWISLLLLQTAVCLGSSYVKTAGTTFELDGQTFYYAGSNAYYLPFQAVRVHAYEWPVLIS